MCNTGNTGNTVYHGNPTRTVVYVTLLDPVGQCWSRIDGFATRVDAVGRRRRWIRTVGDVDAGGDAAAGEGEHVQRGEVRLEEGVLLKVPGPRQLGQQHLGRAHQLGEALAHGLVHHCHEAWADEDTGQRLAGKTSSTTRVSAD